MSSRSARATARSVDDHREAIARLLRPAAGRATESVPVPDALGRTLARDTCSPVRLPVFRNSAMDGYAVAAESVAVTPVTLPVAGVVAAGGEDASALPVGAAIKIMTGAPLPPGADCVVPVEDTTSGGTTVTVHRGRSAGEFVREPGTDVEVGDLLVPAVTELRPRHLAALAAVGLAEVPVSVPVRAAVITTGDELVPAGEPLRHGQIYNSNGVALASALRANAVTVVSVAHSTDDPEQFRALLREATARADVVLTSGGVSQGDFEVVKDVLAPLGGDFGSVAMQPGGPQGLTVVDGVPVVSFPGNPVSTMVSFEVLLRPILRELAGSPPVRENEVALVAPLRSPAGRRQFLRGRLTDAGVEPVSGPGSHLVAGMAWAEVLIDVPAETTALPAGATVRVRAL